MDISHQNTEDHLFNEGIRLHLLGNYQEALDIYESLLKKHENSCTLLTYLGTVEYQLGRFQSAGQHLERSLVINPQQAMALTNLGLLYAH